jgi:hypothetical protein
VGTGSYDTDPSDIERKLPVAWDMRGMTAWKTVLAHDCSEKSWGQVLITCDAFPSQTDEGGNDPEAWPHCEVRIVADVNGQRVILLEAAVGSHNIGWVIGDDTKSAGPVFLPLYPGEVPDRIEVHARARRGGDPQTTYAADERLQLFAVARFHQ